MTQPALTTGNPVTDAIQKVGQLVAVVNVTTDPNLQNVAPGLLAGIGQSLQAAQAQLQALQAQLQQAQAQLAAVPPPSQQTTVTPQQAAVVALGTGAVGAAIGWGVTAWLASRKHKKLLAAESGASEPAGAAEPEAERRPVRRRPRRMR
jgi:hypothetical protein